MPSKRRYKDPAREQKRIQTIKNRHGTEFFSTNARHAAGFIPTKFNSTTGSEAAKKRWAAYRERKAAERGTSE